MTFQTKITVDGIDITNYVLKYKVVDTVKDITPANISLSKEVLSLISLEKDQELIITRGNITATDTTIFRGNVSRINKKQGLSISIIAFDKLWLLSRQIITISYDKNTDTEGGKISAIASDLITRGGLTPDVEDSGSNFLIDKYIIRNDSILDHLKELADYIDYWVYYDPDENKVFFRSRGFETFNETLEVGQNLLDVPVWEYDYSKIANDVTLTGDRQEIETTETFATGSTIITLNSKPESVKVYDDNGATLLSGGVDGQSGTFNYTVDKENKQVILQAASSGTVEVRYSRKEPIKVRKKNVESISSYGTYALQKTIDTIQTTNDAEIKVTEILNKFSDPDVNAEKIRVSGLYGGKAGQNVQIVDAVNNENRVVNIRRYVYHYPINVDFIDVDDEPLYSDYILKNAFRRRIERLERRNEAAGDLITQIISLYRTFRPRRRFTKLLGKSLSGTGWVWGDLPGGLRSYTQIDADGGVWGGDGFQYGTETIKKLVQGQMTFYEDLRDTEFTDSGSTDAVTVTGSGTATHIEFSTGSVWQSSLIDRGTSLSSVTLSSGTTSGTFTYEFRNTQSGTWQKIDLNTLTGVTTSGTSTYLRITESGTASGTIKNLTDSLGQITTPAITFVMVQ